MTTKNKISTNYLESQHSYHQDKKWQDKNIRAIVLGALKEGSIGREIADHLNKNNGVGVVWCPDWDVTKKRIVIGPNPLTFYNALILSHGVTHLDWFEDIPWDQLKRTIEVNLTGTALIAQEFVRATLPTSERKRIILIGSMAHRCVLNGSSIYCASKAGLAMLGRCLAWELAPKGFDVFIIHPSNTEGTPMSLETIQGLERYRRISLEEARAYWNDSPIRKHILQTDDIAALVMFLLGPRAEYLSGSQIELAGGQR